MQALLTSKSLADKFDLSAVLSHHFKAILAMAAGYGDVRMIEFMLTKRVVRTRFKHPRVLAACMYKDRIDVLRLLIKSVRTATGLSPVFQTSLLRSAIAQNNPTVLSFLLDDPDLASMIQPYGAWLTFAAVRANSDHCLALLLRDPRVRPDLPSLLFAACGKNHPLVVQTLLRDSRIDLSAASDAAIYEAFDKRASDVLPVLMIDPRIDPSAHQNKYLHMVVSSGNVRVLQMILSHPRFRLTEGEKEDMVLLATQLGFTRVLRQLLIDGRFDSSANNRR
jgi:hypothetical protein